MAERRLNLHEEFCEILETRNVYYQPPTSVRMQYPGIVYSKAGVDKHNANNRLYRVSDRYEVIVIDRDPDSVIPDKILRHFPMCNLDRIYVADNLYHFVLTIYY